MAVRRASPGAAADACEPGGCSLTVRPAARLPRVQRPDWGTAMRCARLERQLRPASAQYPAEQRIRRRVLPLQEPIMPHLCYTGRAMYPVCKRPPPAAGWRTGGGRQGSGGTGGSGVPKAVSCLEPARVGRDRHWRSSVSKGSSEPPGRYSPWGDGCAARGQSSLGLVSFRGTDGSTVRARLI